MFLDSNIFGAGSNSHQVVAAYELYAVEGRERRCYDHDSTLTIPAPMAQEVEAVLSSDLPDVSRAQNAP